MRDDQPAYLSTAQLAGLLQVSQRSIYRYVHAGLLPGRKLGRGYRFSRAAIDEMFRQPWLSHEARKAIMQVLPLNGVQATL